MPSLLCFVTVWDTRSFKAPLFTASNLPNLYPETNVIFSPDDRHILTGVGKRSGGEKKSGEMVVLSKEGLEVERRVDVGEGSVIRVAWHSRINQVCSHLLPFSAPLVFLFSFPSRNNLPISFYAAPDRHYLLHRPRLGPV